jgi:hypothetical protein
LLAVPGNFFVARKQSGKFSKIVLI